MSVMWTGMKRRAAAMLAGLGLLSSACAPAAQPQDARPPAKPALWKLSDDDTDIYLFGTIHMLPEGMEWRTPALDRAIAEVDELVLETELEGNVQRAAAAMAKISMSPGLPPLLERVPADKRDALARLIAENGFPAGSLDRFETWAAALALLRSSLGKVGLKTEAGVERGLEAVLKKGASRISGLETVEQQLGYFDTLSEEAQRALLAGMVENPSGTKAEFEAMMNAWASGDTDAIAVTFDSETAFSPELREVLMIKRNAAWAEWVAKRMEDPGTVMVAVGAGHLAGKDSVQAMLAARGLKAERVQ
jgi:hypothetical protein